MQMARAQSDTIPMGSYSDLDSTYIVTLHNTLQKASFLDAACRIDGDQLLIMYSRSKYRQGSYATLKLLGVLDTLVSHQLKAVKVLVNDRNIPFYSHNFQVYDGKISIRDSNYKIGPLQTGKEHLEAISGKYSNYTLLFSLDPQIGFAFGANEDPVQVQLNLLPNVYMQLWRGSLLQFQYIIPIWNELAIPEEDNPRPGLITFSQYVPLGVGIFGNVTVGYFDPYRYGAQVQAGKYLLSNRFFLGAQLGYTGYASYPKRLTVAKAEPGWEISDINYVDYLITSGWRWNRYHLQILASYGKGLNRQELMLFAVNRQFKQTNIEFFVQQLDNAWNYGMRAYVPIPFERKFIGRRITVQSGPFIDYTYNGTQYYANVYSTGQVYPFLINNLNPGLIFAYR